MWRTRESHLKEMPGFVRFAMLKCRWPYSNLQILQKLNILPVLCKLQLLRLPGMVVERFVES